MDSTLCQRNLEFRLPIVRGILDWLSCIPDSKAHDSGFHKQRFRWFPIPKRTLFRIGKSGLPYMWQLITLLWFLLLTDWISYDGKRKSNMESIQNGHPRRCKKKPFVTIYNGLMSVCQFFYRILGVAGDRGVTTCRFPYPVLPTPVPFCSFVSRLPPFIVFFPSSYKLKRSEARV